MFKINQLLSKKKAVPASCIMPRLLSHCFLRPHRAFILLMLSRFLYPRIRRYCFSFRPCPPHRFSYPRLRFRCRRPRPRRRLLHRQPCLSERRRSLRRCWFRQRTTCSLRHFLSFPWQKTAPSWQSRSRPAFRRLPSGRWLRPIKVPKRTVSFFP